MAALSPMMKQYTEIKEQYRDCILFFRLGDFYEMFFEDAITAARELELVLTGKNCGQEERAPMCGVPFHAAENYIARLVEKGYKVAICEQTEDPAQAKGIVKREVIQIVTPGTITSQNMLSENENNYLASVYAAGSDIGIAYCDISTGELCASSFGGSAAAEILLNELVRINAREVIINESATLICDTEAIKLATQAYLSIQSDEYFAKEACEEAVLRQFDISALTGLGLSDRESATKALGGLLLYLTETQKRSLGQIISLHLYEIGKQMSLDKSTIRNLEITETLYDKKLQGSLLGVLDKTNTAMGSRQMKKWLREPLNESNEINLRLDAVEVLSDDMLLRNNLREGLKRIYDLERLAGRIAYGNANGKDLIALKASAENLPELRADLAGSGSILLSSLSEKINELGEIYQLIDEAIVDDPPFTIKEGGLIKEGFSEELDKIKFSIKDGQTWIAGLEGAERERTGIKNLKVGFNKVFGYYIEVTKSNYDMVPENYIRKQTLVNCERFITPELKEMESVVLNAENKINLTEYNLFTELREYIQRFIPELQETAQAIASVDVLCSFAEVSQSLGYVKPVVNNSDKILIEGGRHPVVEQMTKNGIFVSNDTNLDRSDSSLLLITGPNMAGKSTYMRQVALIVLMAQAGCFVPCDKAEIGVVDRIFTRIGASDNLAHGQSTFFVEMSELAYILNNSTEKSLIILDEIGRGTSTYDGLSIAWAVCEHLCKKGKQVRTLFATHYHELTELSGKLSGLKNLNVDVAEENGNVVFLHKIVAGSASRSYGIHVAKIAGVPKSLLQRAEEKLAELENYAVSATKNTDSDNTIKTSKASKAKTSKDKSLSENESVQLSFFGAFMDNPVVERLKNLDLMEITPSKAIGILEELQELARKN